MRKIMSLKRRRGAGMTEYVIIVGMIGILLVGVVERYKEQIRVTIVGTDGNGGMTGNAGLGSATNQMNGMSGNKTKVPASANDPNAFKGPDGNWYKYQ